MSELAHIVIRILPMTAPAASGLWSIYIFPLRGELGPLHGDVVYEETIGGMALL